MRKTRLIDIVDVPAPGVGPDLIQGVTPVYAYGCLLSFCGEGGSLHVRLIDIIDVDNVPTPVYGGVTECVHGFFDEYVELSCWPPYGVSDIVDLYLCNVLNCISAHGKHAELVYDSGAWVGSIALVAGTADFELTCGPTPGEFTLTVTGCTGEPLVYTGFPTCTGTIIISFGDHEFVECCNCDGASTTPIIGLTIYGRNRPVYAARLIDIVPVVDTPTPVYAFAECCAAKCQVITCCANVRCDLTVEISGCAGLDGTYTVTPTPPVGSETHWDGSFTAPCGDTLEINVVCEEEEGLDPGCSKFTINIECADYTTGTTEIIGCCNEGTLDLQGTITLEYADPPPPGSHPCCDPADCLGEIDVSVTL